MATKIGRKDPRPECYALMGSKVFQGSAGVNQRQICLKCHMATMGSTSGQLKCVGPSNVANATEHYAAAGALVYITKISKSGCVCVCVHVCPAMHFAMLRCIEPKLGMGVGDGPTRFVGIFSKGPHLGSKVI